MFGDALSWPARLIAINAGEDGSIVVGKILETSEYGFGYNAQSGEYGDLTSPLAIGGQLARHFMHVDSWHGTAEVVCRASFVLGDP